MPPAMPTHRKSYRSRPAAASQSAHNAPGPARPSQGEARNFEMQASNCLSDIDFERVAEGERADLAGGVAHTIELELAALVRCAVELLLAAGAGGSESAAGVSPVSSLAFSTTGTSEMSPWNCGRWSKNCDKLSATLGRTLAGLVREALKHQLSCTIQVPSTAYLVRSIATWREEGAMGWAGVGEWAGYAGV